MNKLEQQFHNFELKQNTQVQVIAFLDDIGGRRYFLKTNKEQYFSLNQNLDQYEEVPEVVVTSAIIKHGYKPQVDGQIFEFGQRKEVLKN